MAHRAARARSRYTTLGVERLEERAVPAVTVSLSSGVLKVTGTSGNDSIILRQANWRVSIDGVGTTFSSSSVKSIVVNESAGNDTVSLVNLKAQPWSKPITVNSSGGNDSVKLLDGRTCYFAGTSRTLFTSSTGVVTLNGKALDWFDTHIRDAALRQLLKTDFADSALDRGEMLGVFNQTKNDGTVSSNEFYDLKAVANTAWLFGSFSYVADLTRDVVLGSPANAHYQGTTLGNLAAGSTGAKLDKLVNKWFLGKDHPLAQYDGTTYAYAAAAGSLFGFSGPAYTDVHQGAVGDCYFVAGLADIAQESPQTINDMFIVNGDGTYSVRFYNNAQARYVTVDRQFPVYGGGYFLFANLGQAVSDPSNVLWVALAEKAYVQMNEAGWLRPAAWGGGLNSYQAIAGGWFADVTAQVANRVATDYWVSGIDSATLQSDVAALKLIGFATEENPTNPNFVGNHQYIVIAYDDATETLTLFNPWGLDNGSSFPGLIDLTLSELTGNFVYWTVA